MAKHSKNSVLVLEQPMIKSTAWLSLSGTAKDVYMLFRCKCKIDRKMIQRGKVENAIINNGELVFKYKDAKSKYGISKDRFTRAIDQLLENGFIDIALTGQGQHKVRTLYAISGRWRKYGQQDFVSKNRHKPANNRMGFQKGNEHWKKRQTKTKPTCDSEHGSMRMVKERSFYINLLMDNG